MQISSIGSNYSSKLRQDPNAYAQQYATQKGISLEEAKQELKSQFGDPKEGANIPYLGQNNQISIFDGFSNKNNVEFSSINSVQGPSNTFGLNSISSSNKTQGMNPDDYAQQYADEKGISLEEAKAELKAKYGEPRKLDCWA